MCQRCGMKRLCLCDSIDVKCLKGSNDGKVRCNLQFDKDGFETRRGTLACIDVLMKYDTLRSFIIVEHKLNTYYQIRKSSLHLFCNKMP